jgi:hypothetical protein
VDIASLVVQLVASSTVGGLAGSTVAPWVGWSVEKRRIARDERKAMVQSWRDGIARLSEAETAALLMPDDLIRSKDEDFLGVWPDGADTRFATWFSTLRIHMSDEIGKRADELAYQSVLKRHGTKFPTLLLTEANRIAKQWSVP